MMNLRLLLLSLCLLALTTLGLPQSWQALATQPSFQAGVPLLMTDGSVLVHRVSSRIWWKLKPDANGNYVNGTWTQMASMQTGYGPLYYASAVLADGRVVVIGGEYNNGSGVWTNLGSVYDPVANVWTALGAPSGWSQIGDAQCTVLPNGHFLLAHPFDTLMADLNPATMTWSAVPATGKTDRFDEEGWTLMPDGTILTVDAINAPATEKFIPWLNTWINQGNTPQTLTDAGSQELGPAVLMPNGKVFATGATGHNAVYTPGATPTSMGTWTAAPDFPVIGSQLDIADGPACLMPNGKVLCQASPGVFNSPSYFFEFDGTNLNQVVSSPNSAGMPSFVGTMLMLPSGQVLLTAQSSSIYIYTPSGGPNNAWRPTISSCPTAITANTNIVVQGTQFNGLSEASVYGDDVTNATNYPLVRIKNATTGHVFYCRTFNHSTMGVATGALPTSTNAAVPATTEGGVSTVEVVANGIPSTPFEVLVGGVPPTITTVSPSAVTAPSAGFTLTVNGTQYLTTDTVLWIENSVTTPLSTTKVNVGQLTATVPSSLVLTGGTATIRVKRADGTLSNTATVNVTNAVPATTSISPNSAAAASGAFTLTVNGSNFVSNAVVRWNGSNRTTTFVNSGQLTAAITAADVATVGNATVTVFNPAPGGGTSNAQTFSVLPIELAPSSYTLVFGIPRGGTLGSLGFSDDDRLRARLNFETTRTSPKIILDSTFTTSATSLSQLDLSMEASATGTPITQTISLWNGVGWIQVDTTTASLVDSVRSLSITTGAGAYLVGGQVKVRVQAFTFDRETQSQTELRVDRLHLTLYP